MMASPEVPFHGTPEHPIHGVLGIIQRDGRFLMIQRSRTVRAPLSWCFPGGKVEEGESQTEALIRELHEELSLDVAPIELRVTQTKHNGGLILYCWTASITAGEIKCDPNEVAEFRWMTPQEIYTQAGVLPGTSEILDTIGR